MRNLIVFACTIMLFILSSCEKNAMDYYVDNELIITNENGVPIDSAEVVLNFRQLINITDTANYLISKQYTNSLGIVKYKGLYQGHYQVSVRVPRMFADTFPILIKEGQSKSVTIAHAFVADPWQEKGKIYPCFPETFEGKSKMNFLVGNVTFGTLTWRLDQSLIGNSTIDNPVSGINAIRMNRNLNSPCYLTMVSDLNSGASKVTVYYGSYTTTDTVDPSTWILEYSKDGGITWIQVGEPVVTNQVEKKLATFDMNIVGTVRFRINKTSRGNSNNGFLSFDDFSVYIN